MKIISKLIILAASILSSGVALGQNEIVTLTSSDFIKGLDSKEYLRGKLKENGYSLGKKATTNIIQNGIIESWHYKSLLYVDIVYGPGQDNTVKVGIHESVADFPNRLLQSFPHKKVEDPEKNLPAVNIRPINKEISYTLSYPRDSDNVRVIIWYDYPFYFFQYKIEK
jgi:hypothetical protein